MRISQKLSFLVFGPLLAVCSLAVFSAAAQAEETPAPGWEVTSTTFPTDIPPGGTGNIELNVYNTGAEGSSGTFTVTDTLPPGVVATNAGDYQTEYDGSIGEDLLLNCSGTGTAVVTCINNPVRLPSVPLPGSYDDGTILHIGIAIKAETSLPGTVLNHVTVSGGGALAPASTSAPITISSTPASDFGFQGSDGWFSNINGTTDTQAGSHPYGLSFTLSLNTRFRPNDNQPNLEPVGGEARDLAVNLPPGLIGNPTAVPECTRQQFDNETCSTSTQVGVDIPSLLGGTIFPSHLAFAVYNLVPPPGLPAQFGFTIFGISTFIDAGVRSGSNYGITAHINDLTQKLIMDNSITLWGNHPILLTTENVSPTPALRVARRVRRVSHS